LERSGVERKLTTLFAADVAGYSRLMEADEEGTLRRLKQHRAMMAAAIATHRGRPFAGAGDSLLAEFASPVAAVRCASEIQDRVADEESHLPEMQRMRFRIGIHLGDVMVEGTDLFGDGVNIAARLEALSEPGGICISGSVFDQIEGKLDIGCDALGDQRVKNIARPVRVYRIRTASDSASSPDVAQDAAPASPSIAVLPFENMSGDPEQAYFSDGIAEDIITDLSKISGLVVIARNSSFAYRSRTMPVQAIARELGVRFVLEGSVRRSGNRARITAQLVDGATGHHIWAERYDRELTDIFAVQDDVREKIVSSLSLHLTGDERRRVGTRGTENLEAYDCFLRGREQLPLHTAASTRQAEAMFRRAIALDPNFATAHAFLAYCRQLDYGNRWSEQPQAALEEAHALSRRAVMLDPADPVGHWTLGIVYSWMKRSEESILEAKTALKLDPNFAEAYLLLGNRLHFAGQSERAIEFLEKAMRLDPHYLDLALHFLGQCYFMLGRYEEAVTALRRRLIRNPDSDISRVLLAACYGCLGRAEDARAEWAQALRINPDYSLAHKRQVLPYKDPADFERIVDGLRRAGIQV
jgi:TolB-like protein/class 3 adenylate cyclase/cytochrome c-type biogenesis protein CcmH/NrfG